ncbi:MAG TPA: thiamine pyrophosphate-binding protein [Methylomirabilota bacterium]
MNVADVLVDGLRRAGVTRLFGVPGGGSSLDLIAAARGAGIDFVLTHGETAACIMAAVTGELTETPGAALVSLGPGAASAVNGVAYAHLDRAPLIVFTDRHPARVLPFTTHQRIDHAALFTPLAKASLGVEPESAAHWIAHAAQLALAEPRGPVHLDLPADVASRPALPVATACRPAPLPAPNPAILDDAARLLGRAARPLLIVGLQCTANGADKWIRPLAEALPAPVLVTYKAKGVFPDPHPLHLGVFTGAALEEPVLARADLVVTLGLDTVELIPREWRGRAPVLHIARAPHGGDYYRPALEVVGDIALVLEELAPRLRDHARADWDVAELDRLKRAATTRLAVPTSGLAPHRVVEIVRDLTPAGTVATVDAGAHMFPVMAFWAAVGPGEVLVSNGLATMGFALPAAVAAQLLHRDRRVVCFTGDGGLMLAAAELETAVRRELPLVVVVFDDGALSLIRVKQEQRAMPGDSLTYRGPDFAALAKSFGMAAWTVTTEHALRDAVVRAQEAATPALIAARIDPSGYRATLEAVRGAAGGATG